METIQPKRAIVHLYWKTTVLVPVDEDFTPDHMKLGEGLTPEQIDTAWEMGEDFENFLPGRSQLICSGWTKRERYIPD